MEKRRAFSTSSCKDNGRFDVMEERMHSGSFRQKSKVPRARFSSRADCVDYSSYELRNGAVKNSGLPRDCFAQGVSTSSVLEETFDTDEHKEWLNLIGERVCISGVKQGILRYYGRTNFAQGYWCGVELDEPVGKNNGTVNGVVYFRCKPNHGIFAPISKVSKLNDLSGSGWRTETKRSSNFSKHHSPPRSDYNVMPDAALLERKFIKNSISDPTFLRLTMKANLPRASESFPHDKRSFTEQRDRGAFRVKDIMNFEVPDASLARGGTSNGSTANATRNYQSASVLSKYGYGKKSQFFSSNVVTLGENNEIRDMFVSSKSVSDVPNRSALASGLQRTGFVSAEEEYEIFHQTPTNSGRVSPLPSEAKRYNDMPFYDYKMSDEILKAFQSHDFPDPSDDMDNDDQMSVDFDDSLGILTPSQMKDFTLCPDLPTSCSDIRGVDFPSSESFDDINDLPEDEQVHDVSVHYLPDSNSSTRTLEVTKQSSSCYAKGLTTVSVDDAKIEGLVSTTDEFLFSISQKDRQDMNSSKSDISIHSQVSSKKILESTRKMSNLTNISEKSDISFAQFSKLTEHHNKTIQNVSENHNLSDNNKMKIIAMKNFEEDVGRKNYDTDGSRDSLLQADSESNTALKEKLTVSWEDCISHNNDCMFTPVERPESVYTVASSDTGYQEDGELEAETGMTTSLDSTDGNKRFSTTSKDSCIVTDDVDVYKIAESNSTSGYSTGLSDSCCNDRQEDDMSGKPLTDEEIQDSVGPCDSEDGFSFQENNSISKDGDMGTAEGSDMTAETVTVLCHDSTSEALCETMVEDATLTEIHDLLLSPEENKSQSTNDDKENLPSAPELTPAASVETNSVKTSEKTESSVSATTSTNSTPEKKMNNLNRNKTDVQRNCRMPIQANKATKTARICDEDPEKKKVVAKSPKKNVMSKIKAMIEATSCKTMNKSKPENNQPVQKRVISAPKKSRWEAVTSKIAASLAEEKTKPKAKREIKSRVDTNLALARQQVTTCRSPKLESVHHPGRGDGSMSPISVCSRGRRPLIERNSAPSSVKDGRVSTAKEAKHGPKSPRPGKACITSRSTSPVAASESSTTSVSAASHNSRSKIALWKGSSSTIASSAPPTAVKKLAAAPPSNKQPLPNARLSSARMVSKKPPTAPKTRTHLTVNNNTHGRAVSPSVVSPRNERSTRISKPAKEQTGPRGGLHVATKPSRPPMWLSKAELTQEIQRLGNLCEARTKELNRLKMETKHVTVGFDAFAALFKYMVEDLNALSVPKLSADLEKTLKQLELTKQDLAYYEREVEEMKAHHCQELNDLSNKLFEVYQGEVAELNAKHNEEINHLKSNQQKQIESLSTTFNISTDELKAQHEKLVARLEQEIICQQEEMKIFQEREIKDLEEKHAQSTKLLQEHIEQLQKKCAELKQHSLSMEDAMRKDTDSKLQWVTTRKVDLEKEVESLKAVLEMKNKELHSLRVQNLEMEKQLEELPLAREKIKMLQARAEDLEALMIEKTKLERKLSSENQQIRDTYEKESKVNKRLSMENEELQWRLRQAEQSLISGSFSEAAEYQEITENGALSPVKSPAPQTLSRSVFFTFMDKDDISSYSPRSQYKKITSNFSANYKTSPGRTPKSPTTSPRRPKSHSEPPQPQLSSSTPRKIAKQPSVKHKTSQKRQRAGGDGVSTNNEQNEVNISSMAESMASSVSSESSVFEHKERLLEEHKDHIMASLEILREQRSAEIAMSEPVTPTSTECMEVKGSPGFETQDMSRSAEFADPKTYYHMTFPVLKEGGIADCDTEDSGKVSNNSSSPSRDATDMHSMSVGNSPSKAGKTTSLKMNLKVMSTSSPEFGATDNSTEIQECISGAISADDVQMMESDKLSKAQGGWRTL